MLEELVAVARPPARQVGQPPQELKVIATGSPGSTFVTARRRVDGARALVPQHGRERHRIPLVAHDQVGVADTRRRDLDEHLVRPEFAELHLLDTEPRTVDSVTAAWIYIALLLRLADRRDRRPPGKCAVDVPCSEVPENAPYA